MPEESLVAKSFSDTIDEFVLNQITPQIAWFENLLVKSPSPQNYNDFGILYARYGLFDQAEKQFRIARTGKYLPAVLNTANLYYSVKDYSKAALWYKQVLAADPDNNLAMVGLARCAYETGDYTECDRWYGTVYKNDRALARKYSYLGAFEQTDGRSFSLADRLENTLWLQSADYSLRNGITPGLPASTAAQTSAIVQSGEPAKNTIGNNGSNSYAALVPDSVREEERKDDEEQGTASGGEGGRNGGDDDDDKDEYKGISSQLDFNILSAQDLADLAADSIIQNGETLDDFDATAFTLSVREDKLVDTTYITSIMTDVPVREPAGQTQSAENDELKALENTDLAMLTKPAVKKTVPVEGAKKEIAVKDTKEKIEDFKVVSNDTKSDWLDDLVEGLKELDEQGAQVGQTVKEEQYALQTQEEVPEEQPALQTQEEQPALRQAQGPQTDSLGPQTEAQGSQTKSNKKYIGFAALAAAIAAFVIAKRRKEKKDE